jgi:hypothetical protein
MQFRWNEYHNDTERHNLCMKTTEIIVYLSGVGLQKQVLLVVSRCDWQLDFSKGIHEIPFG